MKTIGLIGGLSSQSTKLFYDNLNQIYFSLYKEYPDLIIFSVNMVKYKKYLLTDIGLLAEEMSIVFNKLYSIGAETCILTALSMHRAFPMLSINPSIELLDMYGIAIKSIGKFPILVVGTKFIMEDEYSLNKFRESNIEVFVPDELDRIEIERIITKELNLGILRQKSKKKLISIISGYYGSIGQVLIACTTLPIILKQSDIGVPLLDIVKLTCDEAIKRTTGHEI